MWEGAKVVRRGAPKGRAWVHVGECVLCMTLTRGRGWTLRGPSEKERGPWGVTRKAERLTQGRERDATKGG